MIYPELNGSVCDLFISSLTMFQYSIFCNRTTPSPCLRPSPTTNNKPVGSKELNEPEVKRTKKDIENGQKIERDGEESILMCVERVSKGFEPFPHQNRSLRCDHLMILSLFHSCSFRLVSPFFLIRFSPQYYQIRWPSVWIRNIFQFNNNFLRHTMQFNLCIDCNLHKIQKWNFIEFSERRNGMETANRFRHWYGQRQMPLTQWIYKIKRGNAKYGLNRLIRRRIYLSWQHTTTTRTRVWAWHCFHRVLSHSECECQWKSNVLRYWFRLLLVRSFDLFSSFFLVFWKKVRKQ